MKNLELYTSVLHTPLFKNGPIVVFIWENRDGWPVLDVSGNIEKLYGYSVSEYVEGAVAYADHIHPEDITRVFQEVTEGSTSRDTEFFEHKPYRYLAKDGVYHWVNDSTTIIRDAEGNITHYIGYITDITELQEAFNEIKSNELKFTSIFENANEGISILKGGHFTEVNSKLLEMLECDASYLLGKSPIAISPEYQADGSRSSEKATGYIKKVLNGEAQVFDWQHINAKGEIVDFEISLGFIANGEDSFIICLWRDISDRVELLSNMQQAKEKADNASVLKSRFLANMSHEIRTPMNGILGFVDILAKGEDDPRRQELYSHIKESGKTLLSIINDILDISKIESGKLEIVQVAFSSESLFDTVAGLYEKLCEDKDISLVYEKSALFPKRFLGDDVRIKQVIINFLSNALKFTPKGGEILYTLRYENDYLICNIRDNGTGIHKENLEKIFNDFEQEDISTTRKFGGTGLGLSISAKLVSMMHGKIDVLSEYGKGSLFSFKIPLESIEAEIVEESSEQESECDTFKGHILIVEDNKTNQLLLSMLLEDFGVSYEIADDGLISLALVEKSKFDLIFMDENMPNMNGIEASKKIKEGNSINKNVPIVAITANALSGDRERFLAAGMSDYISKPYDDEDIKEVLQKYLI